MRLIDADVLIEKIVWLPHVNGIPATVNYNRPLIDIAQAVDAIKGQLTEYDLEKIIKKLESKMFSAELYGDEWNGQTVNNLICLGDVVEILGGGGVDEL